MKPSISLIISLVFAITACSRSGPPETANDNAPVAEPAAKPVVAEPEPAAPRSFADPVVKPGTFSGPIDLKGLDKLPTPTRVATPGYPGSAFRYGVFTDAAQWNAFKGLAGVELGEIDWQSQAVVYAVLDAQTNSLNLEEVVTLRGGTVKVTFEWIGIEPYYVDTTPGIFAVIDRTGVKQIMFEPKNSPDKGATIPLPPNRI